MVQRCGRLFWLKLIVIVMSSFVFFFCMTIDRQPRRIHFTHNMDYKLLKYGRGSNVAEILAELQDDKGVDSEDAETCKPRRNVAFIKTHKTAGTAVQNILFRYGVSHDLTFALPRNTHDFYYPRFFRKQSIHRQGRFKYNIICHHMRFDYGEVESTMPDNSAFITILREPGGQFEAFFDFFWPIVLPFQKVQRDEIESKERWLDNATEYTKDIQQWRGEEFWEYVHLSKNPTTFDLGFDNMNENPLYISSTITKLDEAFDLILIADYFMESMVLLANLMCWDLEHVASLPLNMRNLDDDPITKAGHARIQEKARRWHRADSAMYDFFNATFWKKVKNYGYDRMQKDVQKLHKINDEILERCIEGRKAVDYSEITDPEYRKNVFKPYKVKVKGYNLRKGADKIHVCKDIVESETIFSQRIFNIQRSKKMTLY